MFRCIIHRRDSRRCYININIVANTHNNATTITTAIALLVRRRPCKNSNT